MGGRYTSLRALLEGCGGCESGRGIRHRQVDAPPYIGDGIDCFVKSRALSNDNYSLKNRSERSIRKLYYEKIANAAVEDMVLNMGPQHPSTHGVLRLELITDGEIVKEVIPHWLFAPLF